MGLKAVYQIRSLADVDLVKLMGVQYVCDEHNAISLVARA
jgi:hypothetical protein